MLHWTWTAQVFFTLHTLTILMAVHYPSSPARDCSMNDVLVAKHEEPLARLREDLATELTSPLGHVTYPQNLTLGNFVDFIFCPTLCYELEYPRTKGIRWTEVFSKALAVFGCIFLLTLISEEFVVPVLNDASGRLSAVNGVTEKALILA